MGPRPFLGFNPIIDGGVSEANFRPLFLRGKVPVSNGFPDPGSAKWVSSRVGFLPGGTPPFPADRPRMWFLAAHGGREESDLDMESAIWKCTLNACPPPLSENAEALPARTKAGIRPSFLSYLAPAVCWAPLKPHRSMK